MNRKNKAAALAVIVLACALMCALGGCTLFSAGGGTLSVTIDAGGGILTSKEVYTATAGADFDLSRLSVPTRDGYTFVGWKAGEKTYGTDAVIRPSEDMTLVAVWKMDASAFLMTFDPQNGGEPEVLSVRDGEAFDLATPTIPVREGYEFIGWKNGDTVYLKGEPNALVPLGDMTFTAEWRSLKYRITFQNGDVVLSSAEYLYGETPRAPAFGDALPEKKNVSETRTAVFKGWDKEIVPAKSEAVYNAVYEERERLYTLTLKSEGVRFEDASGAPIDANYGAYNSLFRFKIGLKEGSRDEGMVVKLNGTAISPETDGLYTVTLAGDGLEITVENVETVMFDVVFGASHTYYSIIRGAEAVPYGGTVEFSAWGAAGYEYEVPYVFVTGQEDSLTPYGRDGDGKYLYRVENVSRALYISIGCFPNLYNVTYVDLDGNRLETEYKRLHASYILGVWADISENGFALLDNGTTAYKAAYGIYNQDFKFYRVTKSSERADRLMTEADYNAWVAAGYPIVPEDPVHGAENVYYVVYYEAPNDKPYTVTASIPSGYTVEYRAGSGTYQAAAAGEGVYEYNPVFSLGGHIYGTEITIRLSGGTEYPTLLYGDLRLTANSSGEYLFTVTGSTPVIAERVYHTVTLPALDQPEYKIESKNGEAYGQRTVKIAHGEEYVFAVNFDPELTDVTRYRDDYAACVTVNGSPAEVYSTFAATAEMKRIVFILRNVTEDAVVEINLPAPRAYRLRFPYLPDCEQYLAGEKLVFSEGATYVEKSVVLSTSCPYIIVPKNDFKFTSKLKFQYYYIDNYEARTVALSDRISFGTYNDANYPNANLIDLSMKMYEYCAVSADMADMADDRKLLTVIGAGAFSPAEVKATQWKKKFDPTTAGATFTTKPATKCLKYGQYSVSISVPDGKTPAMYVEFSDAVNEGFRKFSASTVSGDTYTFTLENARCDFRWYILFETRKYSVTFDWGADSLTLTLPHGTFLSDVALPETFIGEQNGVKGVFTVTRWNHADGTRFLLADRAETVTPETIFTAAAATINGELYYSVADAFKSLTATSAGTLDILMSAAGASAETLQAGTAEAPAVYTIPAGVTLRLPFKTGGYGYSLAEAAEDPSLLYAPTSMGVLGLIVPENAVIELYGAIVVGATIGYPQSAKPYQGHVSGAHAVLKLDGKVNVREGGVFECYGFTEGAGSVEAFSGGVVKTSFVVRDYRGGASSLGVYAEKIAPFNVYEAPGFLVPVTLDAGAKEVVKAVLYASETYNLTEMDVLGGTGIVQPAAGGKIVRSTRRVANDRYNETTKDYEPVYEFRTQIDVYGGARDGVMSLAGIASTKYCHLGINFSYDIRLHDGVYSLYNMYKILPGGKLTVDSDATLKIENKDNLAGLVTAYAGTFQEVQVYPQKQLYYPAITEAGKFIVNGKLIVFGKLGAEVLTERAGASIEIYCVSTYLTVEQREATAFNYEFALTYTASVNATVNGTTQLAEGGYYLSSADESGGIVFRRD